MSTPDTGQADEVLKLRWEVQQLQGIVQDQHRAIAAVRSLCADAMKLPTLEDPRPADDRVSPRAVLAALDRAGSGPDTGQARPPGVPLAEPRNEEELIAWQRETVRRWVCDSDPSRVEHASFVGWSPCPSCRVIEPSRDAVQAPDVAAPSHADLVRAIADPGSFLPRGDNYRESIPSWSARAVRALLAATTPGGAA